MKNSQKLLLIGFSIFILCTIGLSLCYFSLHYLTAATTQNIIKTVTTVGITGAIVPTVLIFLMYYTIKITMNRSSKIFLLIIFFLFLIFSVYSITLAMAFYELGDPKSFIQSLLEVV